MLSILPADFVDYLRSSTRIEVDHSSLEMGNFELYTLEELRIGHIYLDPWVARIRTDAKMGFTGLPLLRWLNLASATMTRLGTS